MTTTSTLPHVLLERLTPAEVDAVESFLARLHELLRPEQICSVILYGSKARGDAHPFSDIDLLLIVDDLTPEQQKQLHDLTLDICVADQIDTDVQVVINTRDKADEYESYGMFLYQNIEREGIVIEGAPVHVKHIDKQRLVEQELDRAMEEMNAAELLFKNEMWRGTVAKTYFVYLHLARALLAAKGVAPQSHKGTNSLFSLHLVKPKILDPKYSTILQNLEKHRLDADYKPDSVFDRHDAETALARAKEFLAVAQVLLPSLMDETANR